MHITNSFSVTAQYGLCIDQDSSLFIHHSLAAYFILKHF